MKCPRRFLLKKGEPGWCDGDSGGNLDFSDLDTCDVDKR